ncbi:MAG: signal recognition particle receptor subunit alpha, partial [Coriobacteriia bacterium]|nr:signal recognition particle receptor subunit alpha [Coriobacteriia bacterium]
MNSTWFDRLSSGLSRTREQLVERVATLVGRGPSLDDQFWDGLEEALIGSDMGVLATTEIVSRLRTEARRADLADADAVLAALAHIVAEELPAAPDPLAQSPLTVLFVGINGTGKTTSVGKIAAEAAAARRKVVVGSADTYRAAAIEQLRVWADRAGVPVV